MLAGGLIGRDEAEHLHLVELVHAEDPARVFPGRAGLAAEAGREAGVAQRQPLGLEDLLGVQRRERDLGGADEEQLVLRQRVDLLLGVGQEAGPVQRLLAHEHRRDHRLEAMPAQLLQHPAHERELEHHEIAFQIGKARTRQTRGAIHVDPLPRQLQVIARLEVERAGRSPTSRTSSSSGPGAARRIGQVGQRRQRRLEILFDRGQLALQLLRARGHPAHRRDLALALALRRPRT